jgi:hypothetical protein
MTAPPPANPNHGTEPDQRPRVVDEDRRERRASEDDEADEQDALASIAIP